jgi:hypothetical protein
MEGGLNNPLALIRTGAAKGATSRELQSLLQNWESDPAPNTVVICPNLNI